MLVAFEHGDVRFPYVFGALWNGKDAPPEDEPLDGDGKVVKRVLRTRSGHVVRLDDTQGAEKIEIVDSSEKNTVVIDTAQNTVTISADGDVVLKSANGDVVISGQNVRISATAADVKIESSADMELKAGGQSTVKGSVVNIN